MSIAVLTQVYDEVRRLAIAGSVVAPGDFRLKKLVPALEKAGEKAPVFAKVAGSAAKLIDSNEKSSAAALLELSTLINAVLYTQGETGATGELCPIETTNVSGHHTRTTARMLKPLLEALTSTGSGRLEIIKDAFERGAFSDLRLVKPALAAIDDPYPDIADFLAEKVLPQYGKAVLPELRAKFDLKGKGGHPRRLALMHRIDPEATGPLVKEALENGSKEVKVVAIECLGTWPVTLHRLLKPISYLADLVKAKAQEVRQAALNALSHVESKEAVATFQASLKGNDFETAIAAIGKNPNPQLIRLIIAQAGEQLEFLLANREKKTLGDEVKRMRSFLDCLEHQHGSETEALLLKCFDCREELGEIKTDPSGFEIRAYAAELLAGCTPKTQKILLENWESLWVLELRCAFLAAYKLLTQAELFNRFSPYLSGLVVSKTKSRKPPTQSTDQADAIYGALRYARPLWDQDRNDAGVWRRIWSQNLDVRWLDWAVAKEDIDLVDVLARPGHAGAEKFLEGVFFDSLEKKRKDVDSGSLLLTIIAMRHPAATKAVIAQIMKHADTRSSVYAYSTAQMIPDLPKSAVPELEAMLPKLPDRISSYTLEYIERLKTKPEDL